MGVAICFIQIASKSTCLVINVCEFGKFLPNELINIITSEKWIKTGIGINLDMAYLTNNFNLKITNGNIDIATFASIMKIKTPNMNHLLEAFNLTDKINKKSKKDSINDWSTNITLEMIQYAANDAFASYYLGSKIIDAMTNNVLIDPKYINNDKPQLIIANNCDENYIALLQEYAQKQNIKLPEYSFFDNKNGFKCTCTFIDVSMSAENNNKKTAKKQAAKYVYEHIIK